MRESSLRAFSSLVACSPVETATTTPEGVKKVLVSPAVLLTLLLAQREESSGLRGEAWGAAEPAGVMAIYESVAIAVEMDLRKEGRSERLSISVVEEERDHAEGPRSSCRDFELLSAPSLFLCG